MKRLSRVKIYWSPDFAYAIGLLATDGNLSPDGRHLNMTSKDKEMIGTFKKCLGLKNKIGRKSRGGSTEKKYFVIQFGDRNFYDFLLGLGMTPAKSKTLSSLKIPKQYFADFIRGCIDGDGSITTVRHPESQHLQLRTRLSSASPPFLYWVKNKLCLYSRLSGGWITQGDGVHVLGYGKSDSIKLFRYIYYDGCNRYLKRKYARAKAFLEI